MPNRLTEMAVKEVSLVDRAANKRRFTMTKSQDVESDGDGGFVIADKAVWTTAYVNTLPDSAFLYVKPGGEKDEDGKTVPRTNRMFPYKSAEGDVDLPHLRNAIARIPQSNLSEDLKDRLQSRARNLLESATKGVEKMATFAELAKNAPDEEVSKESLEKAVGAAGMILSKIMAMLGMNQDKMMSMSKWDMRCEIGEAIDVLVDAYRLDSMMTNYQNEMGGGMMMAKSLDEFKAEVRAEISKMLPKSEPEPEESPEVTDLKKQLAEKDVEIRKLRETPEESRSLDGEVEKSEPVEWAFDMAEEVRKSQEKK